MAKEKVTLTLDSDLMAELRRLVDSRSLSAAVNAALEDRIAHLRHLVAVDEWLAEMEAEDGPLRAEEMAWAEDIFDQRDARVAAHERARASGRPDQAV